MASCFHSHLQDSPLQVTQQEQPLHNADQAEMIHIKAIRKGVRIAGVLLACGLAMVFLLMWGKPGKNASTAISDNMHVPSLLVLSGKSCSVQCPGSAEIAEYIHCIRRS